MRRLLVSLVAGLFVLGLSATSGAGELPFQTIDVVKEIVGPVPPGAEFVVQVQCEGESGPTVDETLTFTEAGTQVVDTIGTSQTCTVEEVATAGATVTYACEAVSASTCTSDRTIENTSDVAESVVTVTNTFPDPPAPVEVGPTFTG